ncbi:MAG TPA: NADPH-dependent glutamate synthase [Acidimicrobiia bacterium]|nr:NADPH-dependent glutamate synthase [Acidimicrobiia bacterium]
MNELTLKERMQMSRVAMPEQYPDSRRRNFTEVNLGLTPELAIEEARRCLMCRRAVCIEGCPVGVRITDFIDLVAEGEFDQAAKVIKQDNSLPAICGRVCPQEHQCEGACVLARKGKPIAIGALERFVADYELENDLMQTYSPPHRTGKRVAVVGSGPAGLACATDLARLGHEVTVFEALHELGGVLVYGIPEFRLPKEIVQKEIAQLEEMGVAFVTNAVIGMMDSIDDLLGEEGFEAVFLGVGAGLPRFPQVPGENLIGVYSANEFLTRVNLMKAYRADSDTPLLDLRGRAVSVFGGGNTAMDAVRTAVRLGAAPASIIYRRSEEEMPARREEVHHARQEGVRFSMLATPLEFFGNSAGFLEAVHLQRMELGDPDEGGRRRPVPVPGSEWIEEVGVAVIAIGNSPNPLLPRATPDLDQTRWGTLVTDETTGRTTKRGVFAGGDIVTGGATVILAMGAGRVAAASIDEYLRSGIWTPPKDPAEVTG